MSNTNVGGQTDPVLDHRNVQEESTVNAQTRTDVGSSHSPQARCMLVAVADMNHDYYIYKDPTNDIKDGPKIDDPSARELITECFMKSLNRYIEIEEMRLSARKEMAGAYSGLVDQLLMA